MMQVFNLKEKKEKKMRPVLISGLSDVLQLCSQQDDESFTVYISPCLGPEIYRQVIQLLQQSDIQYDIRNPRQQHDELLVVTSASCFSQLQQDLELKLPLGNTKGLLWQTCGFNSFRAIMNGFMVVRKDYFKMQFHDDDDPGPLWLRTFVAFAKLSLTLAFLRRTVPAIIIKF